MNPYEVCIIGAGLAVSVLAHNLAPKLDVCVVERRRTEEIGIKACGGGVHKAWFERARPKP